jgi:hypothetical protein
MTGGATNEVLRDRNRRTVRVLLLVIGALIVASVLVGIRW